MYNVMTFNLASMVISGYSAMQSHNNAVKLLMTCDSYLPYSDPFYRIIVAGLGEPDIFDDHDRNFALVDKININATSNTCANKNLVIMTIQLPT